MQQTNSTIENAQAAVRAVQDAVDQLQQKAAGLEQQKADLIEQRQSIYMQPLSSSGLRQFLGELIDHRAAYYASRLVSSGYAEKLAFPQYRNGLSAFGQKSIPLSLADVDVALEQEKPGAPQQGKLENSGWKLPVFMRHGEFDETWPYFFFGDLMKEKLGQLFPVDDTVAEEAPLSLDQRRAAIDTINQQLQVLEQEIEQVKSEISGLTRPLISGVRMLGKAGT